jgi:hypothetical protein
MVFSRSQTNFVLYPGSNARWRRRMCLLAVLYGWMGGNKAVCLTLSGFSERLRSRWIKKLPRHGRVGRGWGEEARCARASGGLALAPGGRCARVLYPGYRITILYIYGVYIWLPTCLIIINTPAELGGAPATWKLLPPSSKGPFGRAFPSASLMASTEALPNP